MLRATRGGCAARLLSLAWAESRPRLSAAVSVSGDAGRALAPAGAPRALWNWRGFAAGDGGSANASSAGEGAATGAGEAAAAAPDAAAEAEGATAEGEGAPEGGSTEKDDAIAALEAKIVELTKAEEESKKMLLLTLADMENLRERTRRDKDTAQKFAIQGFAKDMLDVADNLQRAAATVTAAEPTPASEGDAPPEAKLLESLHEGVAITEKQLSNVFRKYNVSRFEPQPGDAFDANTASALFQIPAPEGVEAGQVAVCTKAGYLLHERVLRPAEVGVAI